MSENNDLLFNKFDPKVIKFENGFEAMSRQTIERLDYERKEKELFAEKRAIEFLVWANCISKEHASSI